MVLLADIDVQERESPMTRSWLFIGVPTVPTCLKSCRAQLDIFLCEIWRQCCWRTWSVHPEEWQQVSKEDGLESCPRPSSWKHWKQDIQWSLETKFYAAVRGRCRLAFVTMPNSISKMPFLNFSAWALLKCCQVCSHNEALGFLIAGQKLLAVTHSFGFNFTWSWRSSGLPATPAKTGMDNSSLAQLSKNQRSSVSALRFDMFQSWLPKKWT